MGIGWLRWLALLMAVALGVGGGAGTAQLVRDEEPAVSADDPLRIGAQLVNQSCSGDSLVVVGRGESRPALRAAVVENAGQAKYLDTAASCQTLWAPLDAEVPPYVVYLGPFSSPGAACEIRMTVEHKGDYVISLRPSNQTYVKCPCELSTATWPVLDPAMGEPDALEGMWIRQLQGMLVDIGRLTDEVDETGVYDATTVSVVERIQSYESLPSTGVVDTATWTIIRDRACRGYDY